MTRSLPRQTLPPAPMPAWPTPSPGTWRCPPPLGRGAGEPPDPTTFAAIRADRPPAPLGSAHWQAVQDRCAEVCRRGLHRRAARLRQRRQRHRRTPRADRPNEWAYPGPLRSSIEACAGADDNATVRRGCSRPPALPRQPGLRATLAVACWDEEDGPGRSRERGSTAPCARACRSAPYVFEAAAALPDEPMTQAFPLGFELIFPGGRALRRRLRRPGRLHRRLADDLDFDHPRRPPGGRRPRRVAHGRRRPQRRLPHGPSLGDLRRSDHAEFWRAAWPAISLTATANFRNPHYHCTLGEDDIADVDVARTLKVVQAAVFAAATQARPTTGTSQPLDTTTDPAPPVPACDLDAQDCPAGKKCVYTGSGASFTTACQDAGPMGPGDPCTRSPAPSQDDCGPGTFCAFFGRASPSAIPRRGRATPFCRRDADCAAGQVCAGWSGCTTSACARRRRSGSRGLRRGPELPGAPVGPAGGPRRHLPRHPARPAPAG
ncbi:MAG: hypothetical protein R3F43_23680 [bacterium]